MHKRTKVRNNFVYLCSNHNNMSEKIEFKTIWRAASLFGIILAAVSTADLLLESPISKIGGKAGMVVNFIVNLAKIVLCIYLMKRFMVRFRDENEGVTTYDLKRMGNFTALLSSLIFAAVTMMYFTWNPEIIGEAFNAMIEEKAEVLDANALNALDKMQDSMPQVLFIVQFVYCFLWGWVLTSILAPIVVGENPFLYPVVKMEESEEDKEDGEEEDNDEEDNEEAGEGKDKENGIQ